MDHRDGRAPVALAADQPIAQPVVDRAFALAALLQPCDRRLDALALALAGRHAIQRAGVDHHALVRPGLGQLIGADILARAAAPPGLIGRPNCLRELEVALVVRRHRHDRAGAIAHQHIVGDPDRDRLVVDRVDRIGADKHAGLRFGRCWCARSRSPASTCATYASTSARCSGTVSLATSGCSGASTINVAPQSVSGRVVNTLISRSEDLSELLSRSSHRLSPQSELSQLEVDLGALALADPVALHNLDPLGPVGHLIQVVQQPLGVGGDLEEPLLQLALLDLRARAPAAALGIDLLVRQHGLIDRIPVDQRLGAVGQALLIQQLEQPLVPLIVIRRAGGDLAAPIVHNAGDVERTFGLGDIAIGPLARVALGLDRGVLGRQAKSIPAERMQHIIAAR